ncbi:MAG: signal peptidase II [Acidobacteria bacterium]|nr:signal peptidase II [Acidobacteriota bacterium]
MTSERSYLFTTRKEGWNSFIVLRWYLLLSIAIFLLDQTVKRGIEKGFINISYHYNEGAMMGLFRGLSPNLRIPFFAVISVLALSFILYYMFKLAPEEKMTMLGLTILLGGALGNFTDRLVFGRVLDFIDLGFWPTFNIADSAISTGVAILIFKALFTGKHKEQPEEKE